MQEPVEVTLKNFYIFNPTICQKEGEEEKNVLFYYPPKTDLRVQMRNVGFSEAIIKFMKDFVSDEECKSLHTLKTRQYFYRPEPNFFMVMTLNLPYDVLKDKSSTVDVAGDNSSEFRDENIHDDVYSTVLRQAYQMYKLFLGPFESAFNPNAANLLNDFKQKLHRFFTRYLRIVNISGCDLSDVFQGIEYLPLDNMTYLHVVSFVNLFQSIFQNDVDYVAYLVNHHLVWSNIELTEMQTIYRYLITNLLAFGSSSPTSSSKSSSPTEVQKNKFDEPAAVSLGRFITCPEDAGPSFISYYTSTSGSNSISLQSSTTSAFRLPPKVVIRRPADYSCGTSEDDGSPQTAVYHILVYNVLTSYFCMFIKDSIELSIDLLKTIDAFLRMKMVSVASELSVLPEEKRDDTAPYSLYFNRSNMAQKGARIPDTVPASVRSVFADMCFDSITSNLMSSETLVKTYEDYWQLHERSSERQFYLLLTPQQHKSATSAAATTLLEISDEMKKIRGKQLKNIFFHV